MSIKETPLNERPRERCLSKGPTTLSLRECLAIILGIGPPPSGVLGLATAILDQVGNGMCDSEKESAFFTAMENSGITGFQAIHGLGAAGQAKLLAAFEIGRRYVLFRGSHKYSQKKSFKWASLSLQVLSKINLDFRAHPQEWLGFVPIHRSGKVGEFCMVEYGARTHVNTDAVELFARILALRPKAFFLFHNHPSGILIPSDADKELTQKVSQASSVLGVQFLGHWIVSIEGEYWLPASI